MILAAFAAGILLVLAACGSSGGSSSGNPSGSRPASGASGTPVAVGAVCSCTGAYADNFNSVGKTIKAWANSVNAAGGIAGHPVKLIFKDDASNPGNSATAAQSLISQHVATIIDATLLSPTWEKAAAAAKIPVIGGDLTAASFYTNPDFYPSGGTLDYTAYADVLTAKQAGATNMGVIYCAEVPDCQTVFQQIKKTGKELGVPVIYSSAVSLTAPNYTAQCVGAKAAHVTALFIGSNATGFARVASDCAKQGYDPIYIEEGDGFKMFLASSPGLKNKLWVPFPVLPMFADKPVMQRLNAALDKYYPGLRKSNDFSQYAVEAWTAGLLVEEAIKKTGAAPGAAISAAQVSTALNSLRGDTLGGFSPPLTFTAGKPHSTDCWYTGHAVNGVPTLANGGKLSCKNGSS